MPVASPLADQLAAAAGAQWTAEAAMQSGVVRISGLSCISVPASCPIVRVRTAALLRYRSPRGAEPLSDRVSLRWCSHRERHRFCRHVRGWHRWLLAMTRAAWRPGRGSR